MHRIRIEQHLLLLITRHEKVCRLLRKKRNDDAKKIFKLENNDRTGFVELRNKNVNDVVEQNSLHIPPSLSSNLYAQQQLNPSLTLQSAVAKAQPQPKMERPAPPRK